MAQSTITVGGQSVTLVELPASPAPRSIEFSIQDAVAVQRSPFTGKTQTQQWPSAETINVTVTYAPLTQAQMAPLRAFLMQMRGMSYATQIGDFLNKYPKSPNQASPVVNAGGNHNIGSSLLFTKGWPGNLTAALSPGDWIQIGYRLYSVLDRVDADVNGFTSFNIWPSLREVPPDNAPIKTVKTKGLFRLSSNQRSWSSDMTRLSRLSIQFTEYR